MKKVVNSLLVLLIASSSLFAVTEKVEMTEVQTLNKKTTQFKAAFIETVIDDRMVIALNNPEMESIELEIIDDEGRSIYSEEIPGRESFLKRYDFSELNDGNYHVKVSGTSGEFSETILLR